jgi:hypothetical protein
MLHVNCLKFEFTKEMDKENFMGQAKFLEAEKFSFN